MNVNELLKSLEKKPEKYKQLVLESSELWNNNACYGYAIAAAEAAGFSKKEVNKLIDALQAATDELTITQANNYYLYGET